MLNWTAEAEQLRLRLLCPQSGCRNMTGQRLMMKVYWRAGNVAAATYDWRTFTTRPETLDIYQALRGLLDWGMQQRLIVNCLRITLCRREAGSPFVI